MEFIVRFKRPMDDLTAGAFGLWLDAMIRASAEDDPDSDHGQFQVSYRRVDSARWAAT